VGLPAAMAVVVGMFGSWLIPHSIPCFIFVITRNTSLIEDGMVKGQIVRVEMVTTIR
jgi:hypothetical protein